MANSVSCKTNTRWLADSLESLKYAGYAIVSDILIHDDIRAFSNALRRVHPLIIKEVGAEKLQRANEEGVLRLPMKFDPLFFKFLEIPEVLDIIDNTVSATAILHLQNGFIFPVNTQKQTENLFQYSFHRDFPRILNGYLASINILFTFVDLNTQDEAFYVVPGSHQKTDAPTQDYCKTHAIPVCCPAGSILIFDSTLWHCGGPNYSNQPWLGINHQFTRSYIKQQIDYVRALGDDVVLRQLPRTQQLLGWYTRVVTNLDEYYRPENERLYRKNQG